MKKIILVLTLIIPLMLSAQGRGFHQDKGDFHKNGFMNCEGLELTDVQIEKIRVKRLDFKKNQIKLQSDLKLANIELQELIRNDETGKKLDSEIDKVSKLKNQLFKARIKNRLAVRSVLTDEQKIKMNKFRFARNRNNGRMSNSNFHNNGRKSRGNRRGNGMNNFSR